MSRIIERLRYRGENEAADYIEKLLAMNDELEYALASVMHNVDKWLDGDDFDNDEVQRADIMREKVLQIIEKLEYENAQLRRERDAAVADIGKWKCTVCNHRPQKGLITTCPHYAHCGLAYLDFEWRGVQEDKA